MSSSYGEFANDRDWHSYVADFKCFRLQLRSRSATARPSLRISPLREYAIRNRLRLGRLPQVLQGTARSTRLCVDQRIRGRRRKGFARGMASGEEIAWYLKPPIHVENPVTTIVKFCVSFSDTNVSNSKILQRRRFEYHYDHRNHGSRVPL